MVQVTVLHLAAVAGENEGHNRPYETDSPFPRKTQAAKYYPTEPAQSSIIPGTFACVRPPCAGGNPCRKLVTCVIKWRSFCGIL
jgi:hypothetical protein